jgi:hypothetical protein
MTRACPKLLTSRSVRPVSGAVWPVRSTILNVVVSIFALLIFGATFRAGIDRGMDQMVSVDGYGRALAAVAAVMTEQRFHQGGYALSQCIHQELERRGLTANQQVLKQVGSSFPQNLRAHFLDKLLEDMSRDLAKLPDSCGLVGRLSGDRLVGIGSDDLGYVDFAKLAFYLFGLHIRAFYYLFFLIYALSLILALIERHENPMSQIILLSAAGLIYVSCYYADFLQTSRGSSSITDPRFMPVLAFIPGVHLLLMLVHNRPPNWWRIVIVIFQSTVIFFSIHIRATAIIWIFPPLLAALVVFLLSLKRAIGTPAGSRLAAYRGLIAQWPAIVLLVVVFGGLRLAAWSVHPVYRSGGWLSAHEIWFPIYYSLQFHPEFAKKYGAYHDSKVGDEMPVAAALVYLKEHPEEDKPDLFISGRSLKSSAMERLIRLAFFEFLRRDPWFVFETVVSVKGKMIWNAIVDESVAEWKRANWRARLLLFVAIALVGGMAARHAVELEGLSRLTTAVTIGAAASLSIPLLTLVFVQMMAEEIMAIQMSLVLLLSLAVAYLLRATARYWPAPGSEDTELGVLMDLEVGHEETEVHAGVRA